MTWIAEIISVLRYLGLKFHNDDERIWDISEEFGSEIAHNDN